MEKGNKTGRAQHPKLFIQVDYPEELQASVVTVLVTENLTLIGENPAGTDRPFPGVKRKPWQASLHGYPFSPIKTCTLQDASVSPGTANRETPATELRWKPGRGCAWEGAYAASVHHRSPRFSPCSLTLTRDYPLAHS